MKKTFFTVIALVAFSGVSMAETGGVEEGFKIESSKDLSFAEKSYLIKEFDKLPADMCQTWSMGKVLLEDPNDELSSIDACDYYHYWLNLCYSIKNLFSSF
ncbi:MAG: hypothetical protein M0D53_08610 [Flavobacterium sp. JAD_PAG50586_2]|nr:MAG: hypothetical protein M0D53_08610 [Flavobacterium sp. JAD_PAG50586_2]